MLSKIMTRSLLIGGLYTVAALAIDTDSSIPNVSPTVQDVNGAAGVEAAPPAAETGPFGLPSLSDLPGFGWLGSRPSSGRGGGWNSPQVNNKKIWQPRVAHRSKLFSAALSYFKMFKIIVTLPCQA